MSYEDAHHEACEICREGGELLMCEGCPNVFHLGCLAPPLSTIPDGEWWCPVCVVHKGLGTANCPRCLAQGIATEADIRQHIEGRCRRKKGSSGGSMGGDDGASAEGHDGATVSSKRSVAAEDDGGSEAGGGGSGDSDAEAGGSSHKAKKKSDHSEHKKDKGSSKKKGKAGDSDGAGGSHKKKHHKNSDAAEEGGGSGPADASNTAGGPDSGKGKKGAKGSGSTGWQKKKAGSGGGGTGGHRGDGDGGDSSDSEGEEPEAAGGADDAGGSGGSDEEAGGGSSRKPGAKREKSRRSPSPSAASVDSEEEWIAAFPRFAHSASARAILQSLRDKEAAAAAARAIAPPFAVDGMADAATETVFVAADAEEGGSSSAGVKRPRASDAGSGLDSTPQHASAKRRKGTAGALPGSAGTSAALNGGLTALSLRKGHLLPLVVLPRLLFAQPFIITALASVALNSSIRHAIHSITGLHLGKKRSGSSSIHGQVSAAHSVGAEGSGSAGAATAAASASATAAQLPGLLRLADGWYMLGLLPTFEPVSRTPTRGAPASGHGAPPPAVVPGTATIQRIGCYRGAPAAIRGWHAFYADPARKTLVQHFLPAAAAAASTSPAAAITAGSTSAAAVTTATAPGASAASPTPSAVPPATARVPHELSMWCTTCKDDASLGGCEDCGCLCCSGRVTPASGRVCAACGGATHIGCGSEGWRAIGHGLWRCDGCEPATPPRTRSRRQASAAAGEEADSDEELDDGSSGVASDEAAADMVAAMAGCLGISAAAATAAAWKAHVVARKAQQQQRRDRMRDSADEAPEDEDDEDEDEEDKQLSPGALLLSYPAAVQKVIVALLLCAAEELERLTARGVIINPPTAPPDTVAEVMAAALARIHSGRGAMATSGLGAKTAPAREQWLEHAAGPDMLQVQPIASLFEGYVRRTSDRDADLGAADGFSVGPARSPAYRDRPTTVVPGMLSADRSSIHSAGMSGGSGGGGGLPSAFPGASPAASPAHFPASSPTGAFHGSPQLHVSTSGGSSAGGPLTALAGDPAVVRERSEQLLGKRLKGLTAVLRRREVVAAAGAGAAAGGGINAKDTQALVFKSSPYRTGSGALLSLAATPSVAGGSLQSGTSGAAAGSGGLLEGMHTVDGRVLDELSVRKKQAMMKSLARSATTYRALAEAAAAAASSNGASAAAAAAAKHKREASLLTAGNAALAATARGETLPPVKPELLYAALALIPPTSLPVDVTLGLGLPSRDADVKPATLPAAVVAHITSAAQAALGVSASAASSSAGGEAGEAGAGEGGSGGAGASSTVSAMELLRALDVIARCADAVALVTPGDLAAVRSAISRADAVQLGILQRAMAVVRATAVHLLLPPPRQRPRSMMRGGRMFASGATGPGLSGAGVSGSSGQLHIGVDAAASGPSGAGASGVSGSGGGGGGGGGAGADFPMVSTAGGSPMHGPSAAPLGAESPSAGGGGAGAGAGDAGGGGGAGEGGEGLRPRGQSFSTGKGLDMAEYKRRLANVKRQTGTQQHEPAPLAIHISAGRSGTGLAFLPGLGDPEPAPGPAPSAAAADTAPAAGFASPSGLDLTFAFDASARGPGQSGEGAAVSGSGGGGGGAGGGAGRGRDETVSPAFDDLFGSLAGADAAAAAVMSGAVAPGATSPGLLASPDTTAAAILNTSGSGSGAPLSLAATSIPTQLQPISPDAPVDLHQRSLSALSASLVGEGEGEGLALSQMLAAEGATAAAVAAVALSAGRHGGLASTAAADLTAASVSDSFDLMLQSMPHLTHARALSALSSIRTSSGPTAAEEGGAGEAAVVTASAALATVNVPARRRTFSLDMADDDEAALAAEAEAAEAVAAAAHPLAQEAQPQAQQSAAALPPTTPSLSLATNAVPPSATAMDAMDV